MRSYLDAMLRYFELSGRSTRMQYWMFFIVQALLFITAALIDVVVLDGYANPRRPQLPATTFLSFVHVVPSITVQVRRLHDIGRSGAWLLLYLVPIAGPLVLLYWSFCASEPGRNGHGDLEPRSHRHPNERLAMPRYSTIPRQVRMGNAAVRQTSVSYGGLAAPDRFI